MSLADRKRSRADSFKRLQEESQKLSQTKKNDDDRFWQPTVDAAGIGTATIRFLPPPINEDFEFVRRWEHGFKGPGGWYIENCLTTLGQDDPVVEHTSELWNTEREDMRKLASARKRKLYFFSNIYVISDPGNRENEGKVFLFKYGKKIFDKLNDKMNPTFEGDEPLNPFDMWDGANFKMKICKVEGHRNYDKSVFADPSPLLDGDDAELEKIEAQLYSLQAIIAPKEFKSYDELKKRLDKVLKTPAQKAPRDEDGDDRGDEPPQKAPIRRAAPQERKAEAAPAPEAEYADNDLSFFESLANDDDDIPY